MGGPGCKAQCDGTSMDVTVAKFKRGPSAESATWHAAV